MPRYSLTIVAAQNNLAEQIEITDRRGHKRVVPVMGETVLFGSGQDADICVTEPGLEPLHLRFVRSGNRVRVEPVRPGGTVAVNGEALFCKDLAAGDEIEVAGLRLRWLAPPPPVAVAPAQPRQGASPRSQPVPPRVRQPVASRSAAKAGRQRTSRSRGLPTWLTVSAAFLAVVLVAALVLRTLTHSTWPSSPQNYVDLAREQLRNREAQVALDTLAFALREATGPTRDEALALEADIRRALLERADLPRVMAARNDHDTVLAFMGLYLRDSVQRPAAREFVRLCDRWLEQHKEICARHSDGQPLLREIEEQRAKYVTLAALGEPDTEQDVIFAARSRLRWQWRDYRGAMQTLDAYLGGHADAELVRRERQAIVSEGEQWLRGKLRTIELLLAKGDPQNAATDLAQLSRRSVLPEWESLVDEQRQKLGQTR